MDIRKFDWSTYTPDFLAMFAVYLDEIAQQGLLSLVWTVTDALILASCQAPRLFSGTAELTELIRRYLPETVAAIQGGIADSSVLNLPGTRMLATRKGNSAAVCAAKAVAEQLPPVSQTVLPAHSGQDVVLDPTFESIWPKPEDPCQIRDDGALLEVYTQPSQQSKKWLCFIIAFPEQPDCVYQSVPGDWNYSLKYEGQCHAYRTKPGAPWPGKNGEEVWLHWDEKTQKTIASANRDWVRNVDGPLRGKRPSLPFSLVAISVGLLGQRGFYSYGTIDLLEELVKQKELDAGIMSRAMEELLKSPDVNPALMVRELEEEIVLLPLMWPILTQSIRTAGRQTMDTGKPPVWVNRILDAAIRYAPYLRQAAKLEYLPAADASWDGLTNIANCKAKSAAVTKAKQLAGLLF